MQQRTKVAPTTENVSALLPMSSTRKKKKVTSPGKVKRVAATVWVDGNLSPRQQTQIDEAVKATVGFQDERGDQVTIQTLPFDRSWAADLDQPQKKPISLM